MPYLRKNKTIIFKLSSEEYEQLIKLWKQTSYSHLSEYIRDKLFDQEKESKFAKVLEFIGLVQDIPSKEEIRNIVRGELNKIKIRLRS